MSNTTETGLITVNIYRDGEIKATFTDQASDFCALKWLHHNQSHSTEWALRYEGYKVELIDQDTGQRQYWKPSKILK